MDKRLISELKDGEFRPKPPKPVKKEFGGVYPQSAEEFLAQSGLWLIVIMAVIAIVTIFS